MSDQKSSPADTLLLRNMRELRPDLDALADSRNRATSAEVRTILQEYLYDPDALRRRAAELERDAGG